jgi:hypothetical protein
MAALATLAAGIELDVGAVSPGVVESVVTIVNFFSGHKVSGGVLEDYLQGKPIIGICLCKGDGTVIVLPLQLKEVLLYLSNVEGRVVDVCVKHMVADHFCLEGVVLFQGDSMVDQFGKGLVRGKHELLLFS